MFLEDTLFDELRDRLQNIAYLGSNLIDKDTYKELTKPLEKDLTVDETLEINFSDEYKNISDQLQTIVETEENLILYVYTLYPTEDENISKVVVDASTMGDIMWIRGEIEKAMHNNEEEITFGDETFPLNEITNQKQFTELMKKVMDIEEVFYYNMEYDMSDFPTMIEAMEKKEQIVEKELYYDPEGEGVGEDEVQGIWSISGYAPIEDEEGNFMGILGVDISAGNIKRILNRSRRISIIIGTIAFLTSLIISIFIGIFFTKGITKLNKAVKKFSKKGEQNVRVDIRSNDEVGELGNNFNNMAGVIEEYSNNLENLVKKRTEELHSTNKELKRKNEIMLLELKMAERVQQNILPKKRDYPMRNELSVESRYSSMEDIGGDIYDVIKISRNKYAFLMADVSGHGVPAALITSMAKVAFNSNSGRRKTPDEVLKNVNDDIYRLIGDLDHYLTAYYGIIDLETGKFEYTNAGHHPALLYKKNKGDIIPLDTDGYFIGAFDEVNYETKSVTLDEGDRLLLFTDGLIEARNLNGEFYDYNRLNKYLKEHTQLRVKEFLDGLVKDIDKFCENRPPDDDRAVLLIEFVQKIKPHTKVEESLLIEARVDSSEQVSAEKEYKRFYNKSSQLIREGKYKDALKLLLEALEKFPSDSKILNNLGIVYYKLDMLDEAHNVLKKAIKEDEYNNETFVKNLNQVIKKMDSK